MSKKTYEALPGVEWVNGQPVPEDRQIKLSAKEALFDLAQGRIHVKDEPSTVEVEQPAMPAAVVDVTSEQRKRR